MSWSQAITVTSVAGRAFTLRCEPEGSEHEVEPDDVLTITFRAKAPHGFEMSWLPDGVILARLGESDVVIEDRRGRDLVW